MTDKTIKQFADKHRAKVTRDIDDGTDIVAGSNGQIYEFSRERLGVIFIPTVVRTRKWNALTTEAIAAGMTLHQDGDSEGSFSFDADNPKHAAIALKIAGVRRKRQLSPEHRAKLLQANRSTRFASEPHGSKQPFLGLEAAFNL